VRNYGSEIQRKQFRIDELLRENNRVKTRYKNFKCPLCLNGERIPPKLLNINKKKDEVPK